MDDQIYEACKQFKQAIEKMGKENVVVIYAFSTKHPEGDAIETGFESSGYLQTLGVCEIMKHKLLNRKPE